MPSVDLNVWTPAWTERGLVALAPAIRWILRHHAKIHLLTSVLEILIVSVVTLVVIALMAIPNKVSLAQHLEHLAHWEVLALPLLALALYVAAILAQYFGVILLDPIPKNAELTLPTLDDVNHLTECKAQGMFLNLPSSPEGRRTFLADAVALGNEAFCYLSRLTVEEREDLYGRWLDVDPSAITLLYPPKSLWNPEWGERHPVGLTCVLRFEETVAEMLRNGEISQFDSRCVNISPSQPSRYVYVQTVYWRRRARKELKHGTFGHRKITKLALMCHVALVHRGSEAPYLLAIGLSRNGIRLLSGLGLEPGGKSREGRPVYELDCRGREAHPLLNPSGRDSAGAVVKMIAILANKESGAVRSGHGRSNARSADGDEEELVARVGESQNLEPSED